MQSTILQYSLQTKQTEKNSLQKKNSINFTAKGEKLCAEKNE